MMGFRWTFIVFLFKIEMLSWKGANKLLPNKKGLPSHPRYQ